MGFSLKKAFGNVGGSGFAGIGTFLNDITGLSSSARQQYLNQKSLDEANRQWQGVMSNSAHQREIADLKAAGLNPILSVTGGSGASTPTGGVGNSTPGGSSGMVLSTAKELFKYFKTEMRNEKLEGDVKDESVKTAPVARKNMKADTELKQATAKKASADAGMQELETQYWKDHPVQFAVNKWLGTVASGVGIAGDLVGGVKNALIGSSAKKAADSKWVDSMSKANARAIKTTKGKRK